MPDDSESSVLLFVATVPGIIYTRGRFPLRICFVNKAEAELRLLRQFEPVPVFFSVELRPEGGSPVSIPGAGKISFFEGAMEYVQLRKGEIFGFEFDLSKLIAAPSEMEPGRYSLSVTYHNQYGEDCLRGSVRSAAVEVFIEEAR